MKSGRRRRWGRALLLLGIAGSSRARAQAPAADSTPPSRTIEVTAGARFHDGFLRRLLLGSRYRDLWTTPFRAELLDLSTFAGGLTPFGRVDSLAAPLLLLRGPDGREYTFSPIDRDPAGRLTTPPGSRLLEVLVPDQVSASHPAAPLIAKRFRLAAGVPTGELRLVVLADSGRLGEFAAAFAGVPGFLESPAPGLADSGEAISTDSLLRRLARSPAESADARAYLRARLLDLFMGDWSRDPAGWRWLRATDSTPVWSPAPLGSTQAFVSYEGFVLTGARFIEGRLVKFGGSYPDPLNLAWNSRNLDRRILAGLARPAWDTVVAGLQARLADSVIAWAVGSMPPEYRVLDSLRLFAVLRQRRDHLASMAARFYRVLASDVDVRTSDLPELAVITRLPADTLDLRIHSGRGDSSETSPGPRFERRFLRSETREVRVHLEDSSGRAIVRGPGTDGMLLRVIGDSARSQLIDSAGGRTVFHGLPSRRWLARAQGTIAPAVGDSLFGSSKWRDWGSARSFTPWVDQGSDIGLFLGLGATFTRYGFRAVPFEWRVRFRAGWASKAGAYRAELQSWRPLRDSPATLTVRLRASGIEIMHYYGFGNETANDQPEAFYKLRQHQFTVEPGVIVGFGPRDSIIVGISAKYATMDSSAGQLIGQQRPYGYGDFGQLGLALAYAYDTRDIRPIPAGGFRLRVQGKVFPRMWDVRSWFGLLEGSAATYLGFDAGVPATVALQVGGKRLWGEYPFQEAASIGGSTTVRGLTWQRYIGDASLYGNAELRLTLGRPLGLGPGGVFALLDVGRVYYAGEDSRQWHLGYGPGIWVAPLSPRNNLSLAFANSEGRLGIELEAGFQF